MRKLLATIIAATALFALVGSIDAIAAPFPTGVGGTGTSITPASGSILIGNGSGSYTPALLGCSGACSITNASGSVIVNVSSTSGSPTTTIAYGLLSYPTSSLVLAESSSVTITASGTTLTWSAPWVQSGTLAYYTGDVSVGTSSDIAPFYVNGTSSFGGNVGIGTSTPSQPLTVFSDSAAPIAEFLSDASATHKAQVILEFASSSSQAYFAIQNSSQTNQFSEYLFNGSTTQNSNISTIPLSSLFETGAGAVGGITIDALAPGAPVIIGAGGNALSNIKFEVDGTGSTWIGSITGATSTNGFVPSAATFVVTSSSDVIASGTVTLPNLTPNSILAVDGNHNIVSTGTPVSNPGTVVTSSATSTGYFPNWVTPNGLSTTSNIFENSSTKYIGIGTTTPSAALELDSFANSNSTVDVAQIIDANASTTTQDGFGNEEDFYTKMSDGQLYKSGYISFVPDSVDAEGSPGTTLHIGANGDYDDGTAFIRDIFTVNSTNSGLSAGFNLTNSSPRDVWDVGVPGDNLGHAIACDAQTAGASSAGFGCAIDYLGAYYGNDMDFGYAAMVMTSQYVFDPLTADYVIATSNGGTVSEKFRVTGAGLVGIDTSAPSSTLDVRGSFGTLAITATSSVTASTGTLYVLNVATSTSATTTLPAVASSLNREYEFKNIGTVTDTIVTGATSSFIYALATSTSYSLSPGGHAVTLHNDGNFWDVISQF